VFFKKEILFNKLADKEIDQLPLFVKNKFYAYLKVIKRDGYLKEPYAKKINKYLFEIRLKYKGNHWRVIYCYIDKNNIIYFLSCFKKKTRRLSQKDIKRSYNRIRDLI